MSAPNPASARHPLPPTSSARLPSPDLHHEPVARVAPPLTSPETVAPWDPRRLRGRTWERTADGVDSVQWIDLPHAPPMDLEAWERAYFAWVPRVSADVFQPRYGPDRIVLGAVPWGWPRLIVLETAREYGGPEAEALGRTREILGGALAARGGEIGFHGLRRPEGWRVVVAVRGLRPRLPRWLYFRLQRRLHERSTFGFLRQVAAAVRAGEA